MKKKVSNPNDFIAALIHKDFYFNKFLETPTLIKQYSEVEQLLVNSRYLACITIQVAHLHKIEYQYGSIVYTDLLKKVTEIIKTVKEKEFRESDIFLIDLHDVDTFIIFLSPPRDNNTSILDHLEPIADRTRISVEKQIFNLLYPYSKKFDRPAVG